MREKLVLIGWIVGILFPFGWLTPYSDVFRQVFDTVFDPLWVHILMHTMLYAVLAYLLARFVLGGPSPVFSCYHLGLLLILVLAIALGQESLQLLYQGWLPGADEWLDIGVDSAGARWFFWCSTCEKGCFNCRLRGEFLRCSTWSQTENGRKQPHKQVQGRLVQQGMSLSLF